MSLDAHPRIADWITARAGRLVVHTGKVDIGQRISTALAQIAHDELTVPLSRIDMAPVRTGHSPDEGITSGSNSIEQSGHAIGCAAATLRALLVAHLAARHGTAPEGWTLEDGVFRHKDTNDSADLVTLLAEIDPDTPVDPAAARRDRPAGQLPHAPMRGLTEMVEGRFTYLHDLDLPGMVHARVVRPPHARATLQDVNADTTAKLRDEGVTVVRDGGFLAVAGPVEWEVVKAASRLERACTWDTGEGFPELDIFAHLDPANAERFPVIDGTPEVGPVPAPIADADLSARYERPYQMHGSLAPSAAMAQWDGKMLTLQSHSQGIYPLRAAIADSLGLDPGQVDITHVPGAGCYGHNGADDAAFEAALVAMALADTPVLLKWSREDEHGWEPYAPAMAVALAARLSEGRVAAYSAEAMSDTHRGRPRPGPNRAGPAKLLANRLRPDPMAPYLAPPNMGNHAGMHRNLDPVYSFPERRLVKNLVRGLPHRTSAMRCLGAAANIFALESFMDELAETAGADPFAFRAAQHDDPRAGAVLAELERQVQARPPLPDDRGRGIAYAQYKNQMTRVGVAVELSVTEQAEVRLHHALIVADAGRVIDADGLTAQLEGGFIQAASWALYEEVTWDREGITSRDWDSYPVIRFDNIPEVEVTLLEQAGTKPVGAGEASPGPTIAAIANAVHDCIGIRLRRMPFTPDAITRAALEA